MTINETSDKLKQERNQLADKVLGTPVKPKLTKIILLCVKRKSSQSES
jgi:hypothetical protein